MYNVVLDRCHVLLVDGVECVTLGHGLEGGVVGHPYYGTSRVLRDLAVLPGWEDGFVRVAGSMRDVAGHVTGFRHQSAMDQRR